MTFEGQNLKLGEYVDEWIAIKKNDLRLKSGFQYERLITLYIKPMLGKIKLKDLHLKMVSRFYDRLRKSGVGVSNIRYTH